SVEPSAAKPAMDGPPLGFRRAPWLRTGIFVSPGRMDAQAISKWSITPIRMESQESSSVRLSKCHRHLLSNSASIALGAQPMRSLELIGQEKPRGNAAVAREELPHQIRTVALQAAVQKHNVGRQAVSIALAARKD